MVTQIIKANSFLEATDAVSSFLHRTFSKSFLNKHADEILQSVIQDWNTVAITSKFDVIITPKFVCSVLYTISCYYNPLSKQYNVIIISI